MPINSATITMTSVPVASPSSPSSHIAPTELGSDEDQAAPQESVKVSLSQEGKAKAAEEQNKNADIDASNLPEAVKKILKVIREIQEKIQKKMEEFETIKNDPSLSDKEREAKAQGVQVELAALTSQLTSRTNDLRRTENELKLSTGQRKLSNYLAAPKG
ncbi:chemotaxis protein [Pseudomonas chlororaphis]|uniref:chemotaxis protein n=1 Tax=Pseudomonas chlororaphis TaxID=587753 RepID=UPI001474731A|nr:chemotaxis protein [Pseudomonas chlororaphis]NNB43450.1 chemotaxis protein [Pseudomonas chlororaphis]